MCEIGTPDLLDVLLPLVGKIPGAGPPPAADVARMRTQAPTDLCPSISIPP